MDLKDSKIQQLTEEINFLLHILKNKQAEKMFTEDFKKLFFLKYIKQYKTKKNRIDKLNK